LILRVGRLCMGFECLKVCLIFDSLYLKFSYPTSFTRHPNNIRFEIPSSQEDIPVSRIGIIALSIAFLTTAAAAQIPKGNVFFGYSYLRTDLIYGTLNNLNGWNGSLEGI